MFSDAPVISSVHCARGCLPMTARSAGAAIRVRELGVVEIHGRNLDVAAAVVFAGGRGRGDDLRSLARRGSGGNVRVEVPTGARSGPVVVFDAAGAHSRPSSSVVSVARRSFHAGGTTPVSPQPAPRPQPAPSPPPAGGAELIWPVNGPITGSFGEDRGSHYHSGLDISAPGGTPIHAAASGTVSLLQSTERSGGYGNYTCIAHSTITTCYAHQSRFATSAGAHVRRGELIGYVGNTGNSRGNHLHFEVREGTRPWGAPRDPRGYLPPRGRGSARSASASGPRDYDLPVRGPQT